MITGLLHFRMGLRIGIKEIMNNCVVVDRESGVTGSIVAWVLGNPKILLSNSASMVSPEGLEMVQSPLTVIIVKMLRKLGTLVVEKLNW